MRIGVPTETAPGERRVALVPDSVARLVKSGHEVLLQQGAGEGAFYPDRDYVGAGAELAPDGAAVLGLADIIVKVQRPSPEEVAGLRVGTTLISFLAPAASADLLRQLAERNVTALSMELVPRISRAQSMDALSSQATVAGYQAVLLGAGRLARLLPMLTTAAGTLAPAKTFVIGAGVAGLQAIATARRLGAIVSAFDVRPVVREQVQSLGASFVAAEQVSGEGAGGYAKELAEEQQRKVLEAVGRHISDMDLVITTAQIPGRPAPRLITEEMIATMRPGSVIVDLAAETGGNCALTRFGETVVAYDVKIMGPANLPSTIPLHASQMYSRNLLTLLQHLLKDGGLALDLADEITGAMVVVHGGEVRQP
ncbi:MAG: Re/Si-specific NAD(P)(+) transhydrogenase subunit alpha [Gemmatimonadales bacterium]|nr:Re/Si-specific NAD(P)(+) transhydrogenase subunit alpha [Gemmatimonadales bacterium]